MNALKLVLLLVAASVGLTQALVVEECAIKYSDLLRRIQPQTQETNLEVLDDSFNYTATSEIRINVQDSSETESETKNVIILHADSNFEIQKVVYYDSRNQIDVSSVCRITDQQLLVVSLDSKLAHDSNGTLFTQIVNSNNQDGKGLLKSSSPDSRAVLTGDFSQTAARSAFPCFDSANIRSVFKLSIMHKHHLEATSPTLRVSQRHVFAGHRNRALSIFHPSESISVQDLKFELRQA